MYEALLQRSLQGVEAVKRHVAYSNAIRSIVAAGQVICRNAEPCTNIGAFQEGVPNPTEWRIIDHCSCVTRLYAIYEQCVHELLSEFLGFLERTISYSSLDTAFRDEHRRAIGQVLIHLDRERYKSLSFESIIADVAEAFRENGRYRILPAAMLAHEQNLRLDELGRLFGRCGIAEIKEWLSRHRRLRAFFSEQPRQSDKVEAVLKHLVDYRNDAAHGGIDVDDVLGVEILIEYADFLVAVLEALVECTQWHVIQKLLDSQRIRLVGRINELYSRNISVAIVENGSFAVGDAVYLRGSSFCYQAKILSLQENGVDIGARVVLHPIELGIRFDVEPRLNAEIYYLPAEAQAN